jgi:hypothetical protein
MISEDKRSYNKGGRPKKDVVKDQIIGVKCTAYEKRAIQTKAKSGGMTVSEYLREMGLRGKINFKQRALPKEALALAGTFNHLAANLNQVARKRNNNEELSPLERAELNVLSKEIKSLAASIKQHFE